MISFDNTEVAFANKSNRSLKKAYFVFKLISISWLNKFATKMLQMGLKFGLPVKGIIKNTVFFQFCGGESIYQCEPTINELAEFNVKSILDYSVEGDQDEYAFNDCLNKAIATIERAKKDKSIPYIVIKLTGFMPFHVLNKNTEGIELTSQEEIEYDKGKKRLKTLSDAACAANVPLMIDAEESWIQDNIDEIVLDLMCICNKEKAVVFNTAQMYRHDRLQYIKDLHQIAEKENFYVGVKIVRGAYMEKERLRADQKNYRSPIQENKEATDRDFNMALRYCMENLDRISLCCGTHNEESSLLLTEIMKNKQIPEDDQRVFFAQLLGMSDHISFNLAKSEYNVAKYVPYGPIKEVMPYLIRRANENTSISGQTGRELSLIQTELDRRKTADTL